MLQNTVYEKCINCDGKLAERGGGGGGGGGRGEGGPVPLLVCADGVLAPPLLAGGRKRIDGVVILVAAREGFGVVCLNPGFVILRPIRDSPFAVVVLQLVHPPLADEGNVTHDSRRGEAWQIAHDVVLQVLRFVDRQPPMLGIGDHVALVEVVRHYFCVIEQREAQIEKLLRTCVDAAQQHTLIAYIAESDFQKFPGGFGNQRRDLSRVVYVRVYGDVHAALARFLRQAFQSLHHFILQKVLRDAHQSLRRQANVANIWQVHQGRNKRLHLADGQCV